MTEAPSSAAQPAADQPAAVRPRFDGNTALLVVDVQNDFADPGGNLYVSGGEETIPLINDLVGAARQAGAVVVHTQDWHPPVTPHFEPQGGTWPVHCVRGTWGAELHPDLDAGADVILRKGTGGEDGYSAFTVRDPETSRTRSLGLASLLQGRGVDKVVVVGLAADVCVKETAIDAAGAGMATTVVAAATRPVDPGGGEKAFDELRAAGIDVV
jgi:nicotinamidase/pyrazinamidase